MEEKKDKKVTGASIEAKKNEISAQNGEEVSTNPEDMVKVNGQAGQVLSPEPPSAVKDEKEMTEEAEI